MTVPAEAVPSGTVLTAGAGPARRGAPSAEELAAIVAAVQVLWPTPGPAATAAPTSDSNPWRFSGRSWARPLTARRDRPWVAVRPS